MKNAATIFIILSISLLSGCSVGQNDSNTRDTNKPSSVYYDQQLPAQAKSTAEVINADSAISNALITTEGGRTQQTQNASFNEATASEQNQQVIERKIIRNARLTIECDAPAELQSKLNAIAGEFGGFVVTSDYKQNDSRSGASETVTVTLRVPADRFDAVIAKIRPIGSRVINENVTGQDVTEEFIDLEARIKTQKALEQQFLDILKRAAKVEDALSVQTEIANVRTEIERLEGRKRFIENQAALSTITIVLQTPTPIVSSNPKGFWYSIKEAFGDGIDWAAGFVLGLVRLAIAAIPVVLFIGIPLFLVLRLAYRRWRASRDGDAPAEDEPLPQTQS
ncbi:MAG: DUF4349 domain-containing protein [Acidobacteriota bacterium]